MAEWLSSAQRAALVVLVAGHCTRRPVRISNATSPPDAARREMLRIHSSSARWLLERGFIERTNEVFGLVAALTPDGRRFAREQGFEPADKSHSVK